MLGWSESVWISILAGAALKGTAVLSVAWLVTFALRGRSAAARHLVWTGAAAAVLAIPFLSAGLPRLEIPAGKALASLKTGLVFRALGTVQETAAAVSASSPSAVSHAASATWKPDAALAVLWIWAAGAAVSLIRMALAYHSLRRQRRSARKIGMEGEVPVLESPEGSMPMAFGFLRPVVFLPADTDEWTAERRRMVLLHELAHIRRGDLATHLLARIVLSLYWWNPVAWIAWREFLKERERAADDLVLAAGERASAYAGHLLEVARSMQSSAPTAWAAVAMARRSQLEGRLLAILDSKIRRDSAGRVRAGLAAALAVIVVAPFAAMRAQDDRKPLPADVDATIRAALAQKNHQLLDQAAEGFEKIRNYEVAQSLLQSALTIRGEVSGETSAAYAAGLVKLGDLAVIRRQPEEALAFYNKAVALGDRPEVVPALIYLGTIAFRDKRNDEASELFDRALHADPNGPLAGRALMWVAVARLDLPRLRVETSTTPNEAQAEMMFQKALALQDPNSSDAATTMQFYAALLNKQGRTEQAEQMSERARAIRRERSKALTTKSVTPGTYRAGGGIAAPKLLYKVEPQYSEEARAAKYQGTVLLYTEIGPDGLAHNTQVMDSLGLGLDEQAIAAVNLWRFTPGMKDGKPVPVQATIEVNFRLK